MNIYVINAIVLPLFVTWFIPNVIRNPKTGEYRGFKNKLVAVQALVLIFFESNLLISEFGISILTIARIVFSVGFTFCMALLYVNFTQKELFGNKFSMEIEDNTKE